MAPPSDDDLPDDDERREFEAGFAAISTDRPHDSLFRYVFGRIEHAASFLAAVLERAIAARIDWTTLRAEPGTFVDERFVRRESDLLFSAELLGTRERVAIYLLFEHQSTFDQDTLLRVADYKVRIWNRWREQRASSLEPLPPILAVVLAHDDAPWRGPTRFSEMSALDADGHSALGAYMLDFRIALVDLAAVDVSDLLRERRISDLVRFVLALLRFARSTDDVVRALRPYAMVLGPLFRTASGRRDLAAFMRYLDALGVYESEGMTTLLRDSAGDIATRAVMTFSQRLIEQGRVEGRVDALSRLLLVQVGQKFGDVPDEIRQRIAAASLADLERWMTRVLNAESIRGVFDERS